MSTFIGKPCKRGHDGLRYKSTTACVHCTRIASIKREADKREAGRQLRAANGPRNKIDESNDMVQLFIVTRDVARIPLFLRVRNYETRRAIG